MWPEQKTQLLNTPLISWNWEEMILLLLIKYINILKKKKNSVSQINIPWHSNFSFNYPWRFQIFTKIFKIATLFHVFPDSYECWRFEKSVPENDSLSVESNGTSSISLIHFHSTVRSINNYVNYICTCALHHYLTNLFLL